MVIFGLLGKRDYYNSNQQSINDWILETVDYKPRNDCILNIRPSKTLCNLVTANDGLMVCAWRLHPNTRNQAKGMLERMVAAH